MTLRTLLLLAVSTAAMAGAQAAQASTNLLTNGGFDNIGVDSHGHPAVPESWGGLTYYTDGTHPAGVLLPGWTVEAGSVDFTASASGWGPADMGPYSLDINGWSAGTISQNFATVAGGTYAVSFAYSRNEAGSPNDPVKALVDINNFSDQALLFSRPVSVSYEDPSFGTIGHMLWGHETFQFVATSAEFTIRVPAVTDSNAGVFFDSFAVTGVPEPTSWALMIVGFGGVGAVLRGRRRAAPATA